MRKLIQGIVDFRENIRPTYRETFAKLALGQSPDALFLACSDSRVVPNLFASTDPGDLFVLRNVGNLVPPCSSSQGGVDELSEGAALEFSIEILKVSDIIVCGHSHCGAARAILEGATQEGSYLNRWLQHGAPSLMRLRSGETLDRNLDLVDQLSQINVLQQIEHLKTYPQVRRALQEGRIRLHAWWFEISRAEVMAFCSEHNQFLPIDRQQADRLLSELSAGKTSIDQIQHKLEESPCHSKSCDKK
ncbi:MAG: carbonic anhydrase [Oligoflexus sp.]